MSCAITSVENRSRRRTPRTPASSRFENSGSTIWPPSPSRSSRPPRRNAGAGRRRARAERRNLLWGPSHSRLVDEGFIECRRYGGRTALFASGMYPRTSERFLVAWEDPIDRAILLALGGRRTTGADLVAEAARLALPTVMVRLRRLAAIGAVGFNRDAVPRVSLTKPWRAFERECHARTGARLECFVGLLERDYLHPAAEPLDRGRVGITVDGPRSRIRFVLPLDPIARG